MTALTQTVPAAASARFTRDRFTWLAYAMLAYFSYLMSILSPLVQFLAAELNMSYTVRGLHISLFALGMVIAGATGERAAARLSRGRVFWGGGAGMALGAILLAFGGSAPLTIAGAAVMGLAGSYLLVMIQATLSDRHGDHRAIALTESNVAAVLLGAVAPIAVGLSQSIGLGWRAALLIGAAAWVVMAIALRHIRLPTRPAAQTADTDNRPLPRTFWLYWMVVLFAVAVEWSLIFWGGDFFERVIGLERTLAASLISVFLVAMAIGRFAGSRLTRRADSRRLLMFSALMVAVGFPLFWLARAPVLSVLGFFIAGLGVANLYPLTLSITTGIAPAQSNKASGRTSLASGVAILVLPQLLGSAADGVGIANAVGIIAVMIVGLLLFIVIANQAKR